jgi:integrase
VPRKLNFSKSRIENLAVSGDSREYHYDTKVPGLAVCVSPAGGKVFYLIRRIGSKVEYLKLGSYPELTPENARDAAQLLNGKVAGGENPGDERRVKRQAATLREAFDHFVEQPTRTRAKRPKSEKTKKEYRLQFEGHLAQWSHRRLSEIRRSEIQTLHNQLGEHTPYVANRVLALLTAIYNEAIDRGSYRGTNPAARIRKFQEQSRERFLRADELPKFWKALEAEPSEKVRDFIKLALFTGQRRSNVLGMRWADLNLDAALWTIPQTKTGRHVVPLSAPALEVLNRRKETAKGEYVFPSRRGSGHLQDPMNAWRSILARAGIGDLRIHDLRRTMGSWQTITGASRPIVGKLLGHTQESTTAIYGRLDLEPVRQSAETATSAMLAAAQPETKGGASNG